MALRRGLTAALLLLAAAGLVLAALLAVADPWTGLGPGWRVQPTTLLAPVRTYLFRQAALNTLRLAAGTTLVTLLLGYLWARLGVGGRWGVSWALAAWLLPGAVAGLLWRPLFPPLWYSQAESALLATGLVMVWRAAPLTGLLLAGTPRAWRVAAAIPLWLSLTDAAQTLTLTGGEPFNASHTGARWALTALGVNRDWGHAASMLGGLALVTAVALSSLLGAGRAGDVPMTSTPTAWRTGLPALWLLAPLLPWLVQSGGELAHGFTSLFAAVTVGWWLVGLAILGLTLAAAWLVVAPSRLPPAAVTGAALGAWVLWPVPAAYVATTVNFSILLPAVCALAGLTAAWAAPRTRGRTPAVLLIAVTLLAHSFPVLLVINPPVYTPALGTVMRFGAAADTAGLAAALLLHCLFTVTGARLLVAWAARSKA